MYNKIKEIRNERFQEEIKDKIRLLGQSESFRKLREEEQTSNREVTLQDILRLIGEKNLTEFHNECFLEMTINDELFLVLGEEEECYIDLSKPISNQEEKTLSKLYELIK